MRRVFLQNFQEPGVVLLFLEEKEEKKWEACSCRITETFPNSLQAAIPGSLSLHKGVHLFCSPRQGFPRSFWSAIIRSEANGNGVASPDMVSKHSKEELIAFFRDIQPSIAESSPKASKRTRKQPPDPLKEVHRREQSHGRGDGDVSEERQRKVTILSRTYATRGSCALYQRRDLQPMEGAGRGGRKGAEAGVGVAGAAASPLTSWVADSREERRSRRRLAGVPRLP
ncbi:uncharacterized protein [Miscanthus floridulus]|uniref:uncharacterized protein n=1 Tax=Miscanthus floridulus TaxID=154761 RepID=UPI003459A835